MTLKQIIKDSLRYPLSDWKKFLFLGFLIMIVNIFINGFIPNLVIIGYIIGFFVIGYLYRIIKLSLSGLATLPKFDEWSEMFTDGVKVFIVGIVYSIPAILIILIFNVLSSPSSVIGILSGALFGDPIGVTIMAFVDGAVPGILFAILYMIIVIPIALMAVAHMANNNSKLNSAFRFHEILNKISTKGWISLVGWYILTGILALIIFTIGNIITNISSIIDPIVGLVLGSFIIIPYLYIYLSRSTALFYIGSNPQLSRKYIGLIIILILAFLVLSFSADNISNISNSNNIKAYNSTTNTYSGEGISFNFPSDWTVTTTDSLDGNNVIMVVSDNATFQVSISPDPQGMSDQEAITGIQSSTFPSGFQKISNNTIVIDGNMAYETTFAVNNSDILPGITTDQEIALVKNGTTYSLDFQAPTNDFNNEKPNFDIILNTFKFQ